MVMNMIRSQGPHQAADGVAQFELSSFGQGLAVGDDNDCHVAYQLEGLQDVEQVTTPRPVKSEAKITKGSHGELVRVQTYKRTRSASRLNDDC
jgi:hypothetical protein